MPLSWLHDPEVAWLIGVHEYQGVRYFNKEEFEKLLWWMALPRLIEMTATGEVDVPRLRALEREVESHCQRAKEAGFRIMALLQPETV